MIQKSSYCGYTTIADQKLTLAKIAREHILSYANFMLAKAIILGIT